MQTRTCDRCEGEKFQMTTSDGVVIFWRDQSGSHKTWFCPHCDWGDNRSREPSST